MKLPIYQIDAFSRGVFTGNPAAVVPLDDWLSDKDLLAIAEENNLSETAFVLGSEEDWDLRWFTPGAEVALCGHATLAAAHAIFEYLAKDASILRFSTRQSGRLTVEQRDGSLAMNFPALMPAQIESPPELVTALGAKPTSVWAAKYAADERDLLAVFDTEDDVANLHPDFAAIQKISARGIICTAAGSTTDFVSRYFAPAFGVPEDPFTGSAHCILTPYWATQLGTNELSACQISQRKGWATCTYSGDRVELYGQAVTYMVGEIQF